MARAIKSVAVAAAVAAAAVVAGVSAEWTVVAQRALLFGVGAHNKTVLMTGSEDSTCANEPEELRAGGCE